MARHARLFGSLMLAGFAVSALPIAAQRRPDMVLDKQVPTMELARASRIALVKGVECLLDERATNVRTFLMMYPGSKEGIRMAGYLNAGDCVDGQAGSQAKLFGPEMLRGALYKTMYQRTFGKTEGDLQTTLDFAPDTDGQPVASAQAYVARRQFASCVVHRNPATARALVLAPVESEDEMAALRKLVPSYDACVVRDQAPMTRAALTGVVAEVLYRLSRPGSGKNA